MLIKYANKKVEGYFADYQYMAKRIGPELSRAVKKRIDRLRAAECFWDFWTLGLGKPEILTTGTPRKLCSIHMPPNVRLIVKLTTDTSKEGMMKCNTIEVIGVCDYHGGKENWFIP